MKKILLSGVKPTGSAHIGNYFGAMKQFVDLQNSGDYECFLFLADYHALNLIQDREQMHNLTYELALDYLAIGLDPQKSVLFKQSDISAHTELAWIFNTIVTMPYLARAHAFKDALNKHNDARPAQGSLVSKMDQLPEINVGTFDYPVLMASDILLYDADVVPVGQDQKQHVEYARDIAQKFNHIYNSADRGATSVFKLPEPLILDNVAVVSGTDGRKMSKSYNNTIPLFASREEITKAVMSIVTDSGGEIPENVYNIHKLFRTEVELKSLYESNKGKYKNLKEALVEDIDMFIKPLREKREDLKKDTEKVFMIIKEGGEQARDKANKKLEEVKKQIGVL